MSFREVIPSTNRGDTLSVGGLYSFKAVLKSIVIRLIFLCQWFLHSTITLGEDCYWSRYNVTEIETGSKLYFIRQ